MRWDAIGADSVLLGFTDGLEAITSLLLHPVEVVVVFEAVLVEAVLEDLPQLIVVRSFFKCERTHMLHVSDKLAWDFMTELFQSHVAFLLADHFILRFLIRDLHSLPGQVASHEIY